MNTPLPTPPTASDLMKKVRDDVALLLNHAVKQPNISIKTKFLQNTVPLIYRDVNDLSPADHIELWNAYNHLSSLLSPVTANSLEVDEELNASRKDENGKNKWKNLKRDIHILLAWMAFFVFAVFWVQGYSIRMSNNTERLTSLRTDYIKIADEESLARKASTDKKGDPTIEPLLSILSKKKILETQIKFSTQKQSELNTFWPCKWSVFWSSSMKCEQNEPTQSGNNDDLQYFPINSDEILQSGNTIKLVLNSLVLPLLLGFLGAIAFLTRNTLNHLNDHTFTPSWKAIYFIRVFLGGLLGVIGPWLYAAGKINEVGLGLSLFAFLLGYSVELAFTLLDKFINYARDSLKLGAETVKASTVTVSSIADPSETATPYDTASLKEESKTNVNAVANLRQQLESYRKRLLEIIELGPVLEAVTLPEYFKLECAPKIETARELLKQIDFYNNSTTEEDIATLASRIVQLSEQSKMVTGKNHPLAKVLRSAAQSFNEALGSSLSQIETFLITFFAGAVAALSQGPSAYERWQAYVWAQPFNARFISGITLSTQDALKCLKSTNIFQMAFKDQAAALAETLLNLAASPQSSEELTEQIWQNPTQLVGLTENLTLLFGSVEVFAEGWNEYRHCLVRYILQKIDFPNDRFTEDGALLTVGETLAIVDNLRQNKISEKDLDILCHLSLELVKRTQTSSTFDTIGLIRRAITGEDSL